MSINKDAYYQNFKSQMPQSAKKINTTKKDNHNELINFEFNLGRIILSWWDEKERDEHNSRKNTTIVLLFILAFQLVMVNIIIINIGRGKLEFSDETIKVFITGTFVEITALLGVIFAYFFKERKIDTLKVALEVFEKINRHNAKGYDFEWEEEMDNSTTLYDESYENEEEEEEE